MDDDVSGIALELADGVATVRLNRPEKLNALHPAMSEALALAAVVRRRSSS